MIINSEAKKVYAISKSGKYNLLDKEVDFSEDQNDCYFNSEIIWDQEIKPNNSPTTNFTVKNVSAVDAILELKSRHENVAVLNFASAIHPGGGFIRGAIAQEEDICRASNLYSILETHEEYYNFHAKDKNNKYYSDAMIYSAGIVFFKDANGMFLDSIVKADVITCAAPNLMGKTIPDDLESIFTTRAEKVLSAALDTDTKAIILGAWGCGAFGNPPELVASVWKKVLLKYHFDEVYMAVYDRTAGAVVYNLFKKEFSV